MTVEKTTETVVGDTSEQVDKTNKHTHHHGWLGKHFCIRNFKKLGALGAVIFVLHILFHVVEILLLPAILVWLGWQ